MATNAPTAPVGPVPLKDVVTIMPERAPEDQADLVSALPSKMLYGELPLRCYQGFWLPESWVPAAAALQRRFQPRSDDVIVASVPKCGTTWAMALAFATMARRAHPPDGLFAGGREGKLDALPSPRLMYTHLPLTMIPRAVAAADDGGAAGGGCRVVYVCREPKDMVVSLWHYLRTVYPNGPGVSILQGSGEKCSR
ncbi:hypothetical protein ACP70R_003690 [Stipagrostis hirtigluma subsp. patula]